MSHNNKHVTYNGLEVIPWTEFLTEWKPIVIQRMRAEVGYKSSWDDDEDMLVSFAFIYFSGYYFDHDL